MTTISAPSLHEERNVQLELRLGRIEPEDENAIEALVRYHDEVASGIERHVARVRAGLLGPVRACSCRIPR